MRDLFFGFGVVILGAATLYDSLAFSSSPACDFFGFACLCFPFFKLPFSSKSVTMPFTPSRGFSNTDADFLTGTKTSPQVMLFASLLPSFSPVVAVVFVAKSCDGDGSDGEEDRGVIDPCNGVATRDGEDERITWPANAMKAERRLRQIKETYVSFAITRHPFFGD